MNEADREGDTEAPGLEPDPSASDPATPVDRPAPPILDKSPPETDQIPHSRFRRWLDRHPIADFSNFAALALLCALLLWWNWPRSEKEPDHFDPSKVITSRSPVSSKPDPKVGGPNIRPSPWPETLDGLLDLLRSEGRDETADQLRSRIAHGQEMLGIYAHGGPIQGHVIVGQLVVEGTVDPRFVTAQMEILQDGYFADTVAASGRPVGFRLHGYEPVSVIPKAGPGSIEIVGQVQMKPVPNSRQAALEGVLEYEKRGNDEVKSLRLAISLESGQINTLSHGTEPRDPRFMPSQLVPVDAQGRFSIRGLSPASYTLYSTSTDFVPFFQTCNFLPGRTRAIGTVRLERPRSILVKYLLAKEPPFQAGNPASRTVLGGEEWKADPASIGPDLIFEQRSGSLAFRGFYRPCSIADLGAGELEDHRVVDMNKCNFVDPDSIAPVPGRIYLLDQKALGHWVLFKLAFDEK